MKDEIKVGEYYAEAECISERVKHFEILKSIIEKQQKEEKTIYKADYMQIPFDILTKENLDKLEKHCKKAIHYERGNIKEEHEVVLALLYKYQDSIPKEAIRELFKEQGNYGSFLKDLKELLGDE